MSDFVKPAIDDVIISLEPGGHEYAVPPRVAAYINQLQRENARLKKELNAPVAMGLPESSERQLTGEA